MVNGLPDPVFISHCGRRVRRPETCNCSQSKSHRASNSCIRKSQRSIRENRRSLQDPEGPLQHHRVHSHDLRGDTRLEPRFTCYCSDTSEDSLRSECSQTKCHRASSSFFQKKANEAFEKRGDHFKIETKLCNIMGCIPMIDEATPESDRTAGS